MKAHNDRIPQLLVVFAAAALTIMAGSAMADNYAGVTALIKSRQYQAANTIIKQELAQKAVEPRWYHAKGYVLEMSGNGKAALPLYARAVLEAYRTGRDQTQADAAVAKLAAARPDLKAILKRAAELEREKYPSTKQAAGALYQFVHQMLQAETEGRPVTVAAAPESSHDSEKHLGYPLRSYLATVGNKDVKKAPASANSEGFAGHIYKLIQERSTWQEAHDACKKLGGYLVCVESRAEWVFILDLLKKSPKMPGNTNSLVWSGGTGNRWITGPQIDATLPDRWYDSQSEGYVHLDTNGFNMGPGWGRWNGTQRLYFICEWEK